MDGVAKLVKLRHSVTILHVKMEVRAKVHVQTWINVTQINLKMAGNVLITIPDILVFVHLDTWVNIVIQKITVFTIRVMDMGLVH